VFFGFDRHLRAALGSHYCGQLDATDHEKLDVSCATTLDSVYQHEALRRHDPAGAEPAAADAVSMFTALEEQLGLKLLPQSAPAEVLVVDHVEQPTPN